MKRKLLIAAILLIIIIGGVTLVGGWMLASYAFTSERHATDNLKARYDSIEALYPDMVPWLDSLRTVGALRDTFIVTSNGLRGHAFYVRNPLAHGRTAILVHGYKDSAIGMLPIARIYHQKMGWNIVLPDLYGHGQSQGDHIRMGWLDRHDVILWAKAMQTALQSKGDSTMMVLHGVSMGAATVMYCSGDRDLPEYVRGIIEDCGYSDVWNELRLQLNKQFHLPAFPLMYSASFINKMQHSWRLGEASAIESVARSTVPMLFIHGANDTFVPTQMVYPLYDVKHKGYKKLWIAPGSEHALSYHDHPTEYTMYVEDFVKELQHHSN